MGASNQVKKRGKDEVSTSDKNILYLNLAIGDISEAIKERVTKKLERAVVIPHVVIDRAAQKASDMTSPRVVAQALGQALCKQFPKELQKKGITAEMEEVFRELTFVVLQLRILHVDPMLLASSWLSGGFATMLLQTIGADNRKYFEADYLPTLLTNFLADAIPAIVEEKMSDKRIEADIKVLKAEEQAIYFFSKLNQLRQEEVQRTSRNPVKKLRRRISSFNSSTSVGSSEKLRSDEEESVSSGVMIING